MSDPNELDQADRDALLRWRLALGPGAERVSPQFSLDALQSLAASYDIDPSRVGDLDRALSFVYDEEKAGQGPSRPYIPKWLTALREFFRNDVVALVQQDAIEKKGLTELLFEPETLPLLEKNVELVATLIAAKGLVPDTAREAARQIVREVVEEVRKKLETEMRTAVIGAIRRDRTSPLKVARNIDWKRTIQKNLRGWDAARRRLLPERFYFWANQRRRHEWDVAILVDQSGSMGESVVYSSIMAAIFASIDVLRTRLLFFDTEVVDVTPMLTDPVDVLFAAQLGGGTDINRAVAYAQERFIEQPEKTLMLLISDLEEGGDRAALVARMQQLVDSRVKVVCLLALTDAGKPSYDHQIAARLGKMGIPCFGCTPKLLPGVIERVMKGQDLAPLLAEAENEKR
ncbi:Mg-chelatase subunit ChlD [Minicystis rosea]|nr:Mg-chelatase subunit ChlD [Minicystis rosea]